MWEACWEGSCEVVSEEVGEPGWEELQDPGIGILTSRTGVGGGLKLVSRGG